MLKSVHAEESVREFLEDVAPDSGFVTGLILGQQCQQRAYVVHLPPTPNFESKEENEEPSTQVVQTLSDLNAYNLQSHAKNVSGLLSGGLHILGVYSVGRDDNAGVLNSKESKKLQTLLGKLDSTLPEQLVLHYNAGTKKALCKYMDSKQHLTNVDFKFQSNAIPWEQVETEYAFDCKVPLAASSKMSNAKSNLKTLLEEQETLLKNSHCLIEGALQDGNSTLDALGAGDGESKFTAQFFIQTPTDPEATVTKKKCSGQLIVSGQVHGRIFVHPKTTVAEAIEFLKEDVLRSLRTRIELHTDALIEEEEGSPEEKVVQHDLPRRVLFQLPHSTVKISNYLFPGEGSSDSQASLELLLGCKLDSETEDLEEEVAYPEMMLPDGDREFTPAGTEPTKVSNVGIYLALAGLVVVIAICFGMILDKD